MLKPTTSDKKQGSQMALCRAGKITHVVSCHISWELLKEPFSIKELFGVKEPFCIKELFCIKRPFCIKGPFCIEEPFCVKENCLH